MQVKEKLIATGAVTENKIGALAVTEGKIGPSAVTNGKIANLAVDATKLATNAVEEAKINAGAVTENKIGGGAVTEGKIGALAVTEGKIGALAVTEGKIGPLAVTNAKLALSSVDDDNLTAGAKQGVLESRLDKNYVSVSSASAGTSASQAFTDEIFTAATRNIILGSFSKKGIITSTLSNDENIIEIRLNGTKQPLRDNLKREIYGKLSHNINGLTGTVTFTNGVAAVTGVGTLFLAEVSPNDYIRLDADDVFYKVLSVADNLNLTLTSNYTDTGGAGAATNGTLNVAYKVFDGSEQNASPNGETIDFRFAEMLDVFERSISGLTLPYIGKSDTETVFHNSGTNVDVQASGGDSTTIQGGINLLAGNNILDTLTKVNVEAGTYAEDLTFVDLRGHLELLGDTRDMPGTSFVHGEAVLSDNSDAGSGTITLANAGNDITVTATGTNPDFDVELVNGDVLYVVDNTGTGAEVTVDSVANNVITLTAAAPTIGGVGSSMTVLPDRIISSSANAVTHSNPDLTLTLNGFAIKTTLAGSNTGLKLTRSKAILKNITISGQIGIDLTENAIVYSDDLETSIYNCQTGISSESSLVDLTGVTFADISGDSLSFADNSNLLLTDSLLNRSGTSGFTIDRSNASLANVTSILGLIGAQFNASTALIDSSCVFKGEGAAGNSDGILATNGASVDCSGATVDDYDDGTNGVAFHCDQQSTLIAIGCTATNSETGYLVENGGFLDATSTSGNNSGNTTNYSPGTTETQGNVFGLIKFT